MLKVGLTGGIACGKSTVADLFVELGAGLVDTDVIAREVVAPGSAALTAIRERFGAAVLTDDGALDRRRLRTVVFADPAERRALESILHPLIRERTRAEIDRLSAPYAIIAVPLLVETGFGELVDRVLVVDCPPALQLARLMRRDRIDEPEARRMLAAQTDRATRLDAADDVIDNGGEIESTRRQVAALHERYVALAALPEG